MNTDDHNPRLSDFDELFSALCDDRLTAEQQIQIDALLRTDPAARREYLKYMYLQASLFRILRVPADIQSVEDARWATQFTETAGDHPELLESGILLSEDESAPTGLDDALISSAIQPTGPSESLEAADASDSYILPPLDSIHPPAQPAPIAMPASPRRKARFFSPWRSAGIAVAAGMALAVGVVWLVQRGGAGSPAPQPFARMTASVDAQWASASPDASGILSAHTPLTLTAGYVELTFAKGGKIVAEAPAQFTIDSATALSLTSGKLAATVVGGGFVVYTPSATLTDLGTAFGVQVDPQHRTYLDVFQGRVQASTVASSAATTGSHTSTGNRPPVASSQIVSASHAVDINADGSRMVTAPARPLAFVQPSQFAALQQQPSHADPAFVRWQAFSQQLRLDPSLVAYYPFERDIQTPSKLLNRAQVTLGQGDGLIENADWGAGRFAGKQALVFDGTDSRVKLDLPAPMMQMTLAFWMEIQTPVHALNGFLMSDDLGKPGEMQCQIGGRGGMNFNLLDSANGSSDWKTFTAHDDAQLVTPGRWKLIALVYDASARDQVRWYVDGALLSEETRIQPPVAIRIGSAQIGNFAASPGSDRPQRSFHGRIDEMAIFNRVLGDQEIEAMYHAGAAAAVH